MNLYNTQIHPQIGPALSAKTWVSSPVVGASTTFSISVSRDQLPINNALVTLIVKDAYDSVSLPLTIVPADSQIPGSYTITPSSRSIFVAVGASYRLEWVITVPASGFVPELVLPVTQEVQAMSNSFAGQAMATPAVAEATIGLALGKSGFPSTLSIGSLAQVGISTFAAPFDHVHGTPSTWPVTIKSNGTLIGAQSTLNFLSGVSIVNNLETSTIDITVIGGQSQSVIANPFYIGPANAQFSTTVLKNTTTNSLAYATLTIDGATPSSANTVTVNNQSSCAFSVNLVANRSGLSAGMWTVSGLLRRGSSAASTTLVGITQYEVVADSDLTQTSINIDADTVRGGLLLQVLGLSGQTINWVATVQTTEVT